MSDRLNEIRARLDALTAPPILPSGHPRTVLLSFEMRDLFAADIAWLLTALESEQAHAATLIERIDSHLLTNVRLLAEVKRLRNTTIPIAEPLCYERQRTCTVCGRAVSECGDD